ncbi:hypothetical protein SKAU_G00247390 [Synaphobranchus kaupii]|uniref:Uncharacterized protein n=1 Tax=Synaphobranchus kaupii TaxID=118154 RepID=A0A9Q1IPG6_SYNKA|nr:hypothetical protein SKAU_G00247390 [Synaphobranchus kaupii]
MIRLPAAQRFGAKITASSQSAHQADGSSPMVIVGETRLVFSRGTNKFHFEGLVVENLDVDILAGTPFMSTNDISVHPAKRQVTLGDGTSFTYGSVYNSRGDRAVRRAIVLRAPPIPTTIWPGEFIEVDLPSDAPADSAYVIEPRLDAPSVRRCDTTNIWPCPGVISGVAGKLRIPNLSSAPHILKCQEHFCQVDQLTPLGKENQLPRTNFISPITRSSQQYDSVFDPAFTGYNGAVGPFETKVNMGPVEPPQRKGRLPQYGRDRLTELQQKFDELESLGVF